MNRLLGRHQVPDLPEHELEEKFVRGESAVPAHPTRPARFERLATQPAPADRFVRGTLTPGRGPGGQAINKTNSSVSLVHIPTGIRVQSQPTRSREQNRYVARQILKDRLDLMRARGELPNPDGSYTTPREMKPPAEMSRKERLAAEARTWSKQELRWEKERRRKLNRKKKVNKRKKEAEEDGGEEGTEK